MAGKKPSKVNYGNKTKEIDRPGKATLYVAGFKAERNICPNCKKETRKGIVYEDQNILYCSRGCIARASVVL
jgi:hypothetical protein